MPVIINKGIHLGAPGEKAMPPMQPGQPPMSRNLNPGQGPSLEQMMAMLAMQGGGQSPMPMATNADIARAAREEAANPMPRGGRSEQFGMPTPPPGMAGGQPRLGGNELRPPGAGGGGGRYDYDGGTVVDQGDMGGFRPPRVARGEPNGPTAPQAGAAGRPRDGYPEGDNAANKPAVVKPKNAKTPQGYQPGSAKARRHKKEEERKKRLSGLAGK